MSIKQYIVGIEADIKRIESDKKSKSMNYEDDVSYEYTLTRLYHKLKDTKRILENDEREKENEKRMVEHIRDEVIKKMKNDAEESQNCKECEQFNPEGDCKKCKFCKECGQIKGNSPIGDCKTCDLFCDLFNTQGFSIKADNPDDVTLYKDGKPILMISLPEQSTQWNTHLP